MHRNTYTCKHTQGKGGSRKGSKAEKAAAAAAAAASQSKTPSALSRTWLELEGGAAAVDDAFAHLARLLSELSQPTQQLTQQGQQPQQTQQMDAHSTHAAHTLLLGLLQEPQGVSNSVNEHRGDALASGESVSAGNEQSEAAGGVQGGGLIGLPVAATPSQRLALLPHAIELLQVRADIV